MAPPTVAILGSTGYVGKFLTPALLQAVKEKRIAELRVLTTEAKINSDIIQSYVASGAKPAVVSCYEDVPTLIQAFTKIDVVVSALGTNGAEIDNIRKAILEAMVITNVKVYIPSEFGTNYLKSNLDHPVFSGKRNHFEDAKAKGLHPIRIFTGDIMEASFGKWFGLDCITKQWTLVGDAADKLCAMTAERDVARFLLAALLLAHSDVSACPDTLEVYSDMKTLREYANAFDAASGGEIKITSVPLGPFIDEFKKNQEFADLIMILFAQGAYDHTNANGNRLLNPNESKWQLKKIEEYAKETNGEPCFCSPRFKNLSKRSSTVTK